jgi:NAD(P)-dependent dehydrogenase (short-subunit alcohol dehydrogenase family)
MTQQGTAAATAAFAIPTECRRYVGRVAIVAGGAQGLARIVARRLAEEGASVVIADLLAEKAERTANELSQQTGQPFIAVGGDLSRPGVAEEVVGRAKEQFGRVDTLIQIAAYEARLPFLDFSEELMQRSVDSNVWALVRMLRAVLPIMMEQRYGRIVTTGGGAFESGGAFHTFLAGIGKASQVGLATTIAGEFGAFGITANCISPGGMETRNDGTSDSTAGGREPEINPTAAMLEQYQPAARGTAVKREGVPAGRAVDLTEVAAAYAFLGSYEASWITGNYLKVNGGMSML